MVHIGRIALDRIVEIRGDPLLSSCLRKASAAACPAYWVMTTEPTKSQFIEFVDQTQYFLVIRNSSGPSRAFECSMLLALMAMTISPTWSRNSWSNLILLSGSYQGGHEQRGSPLTSYHQIQGRACHRID